MKIKLRTSEEVVQLLRRKMPDIWDGPFDVKYKEKLMHIYVETEDPTNDKTGLWKYFPDMRYHGYYIIIVKTPPGYLDIGIKR
jgi:hypothetical protein